MNIELLAPAGSYQTMAAAIEAGADAVYMGGLKFGARAFAENGDEDTMIAAIRYVHLHGKHLYLTVNTLLKEKELEEELYAYLKPLYEAGLDAVIVQDPGVMMFVKKHFPDMHIHASTQMTITGEMSAAMLEEMGCTRIVTARELSLKEIASIRQKTSLEIESFIHGALCYCYSGQCLMSSLFGGRSGNRGRCAQPCRLPYSVSQDGRILNSEQSQYVLSPKDMCTIELLPEIIRSGVTSLKIEGRMKRPEYTAGVVRIYRKYLDLYLNNKKFYDAHPEKYKVEKEDLQELFDLYNRDGFHTGYYKDHNGPKMMALRNEKLSKGQKIRNEALFQRIKGEYIDKQKKLPLKGYLRLKVKEPASFVVMNALEDSLEKSRSYHYKADVSQLYCAEVQGQIVDAAQKQPLTKERILAQMNKTGNTPFGFIDIDIEMDENIFIPMQALNELRRAGLEEYDACVQRNYTRTIVSEAEENENHKVSSEIPYELNASVETIEQLKLVMDSKYVSEIYASITMFEKDKIYLQVKKYIELTKAKGKSLYLALPFIHRKDTLAYLDAYYKTFVSDGLAGYLVRSIESLAYLRQLGLSEYVVADANLYTYNNRAKAYYRMMGVLRDTVPYELNAKEIRGRDNTNSEMIVYGYQPLMVSAQCIKKNLAGCSKKSEILTLEDRYKKKFCVKCVCDFCYTIIYNSIPLGIWKEASELKEMNLRKFRMNFTIERPEDVMKLLKKFGALYLQEENVFFETEQFTKGHFKRGVE